MIGVVQNESLAGKIIQGAWKENDKLRDVGYEILAKYKYKCSECGFISLPSRLHADAMMIPVDLSHAGLAAQKVKGSTCLCPLCASSMATNWSVLPTIVDGEKKPAPGFLIYLPQKSQAEVTRLAAYTLVCSTKKNDHPLFSVATDINVVMGSLAKEVGEKIPVYSGTNADFTKALALLPKEFYDKRTQIIGPLRWWPNMSYWSLLGRYMQAATFDGLEKSCGIEKKLKSYLLNKDAE